MGDLGDQGAIQTVLERMRQNDAAPALWWRGREYSYGEFGDLMEGWIGRLAGHGVGPGVVCGFQGDYSPNTAALIFALMRVGAILVPLTRAVEAEMAGLLELAGVQVLFRFDPNDDWSLENNPDASQNALIEEFRKRNVPGLVVFTSGSTGKPKGILQDCDRVMRKFVEPRRGWRTVLFLMMDHFGGFNTLLSSFAYGGVGVCLPGRSPEAVCRAIQDSRANLLPATPTFLNFLIASRVHRDFDLGSVELITYGTEVMPEATLAQVRGIFPNARIKQTYGLSELGVLRSSSESDGSLWVKLGGAGFEVKVVDSTLWVRSEANMVGYLNAPSPFDGEGWLCTGDQVEVRGEFMRILGRRSDMINIGGQKVFPAEVETVLLEAGNVCEATVFGVTSPLMGHVAHARISLIDPEDPDRLSERLRKHCLTRLARYKVPVRFQIVESASQHGERFKKIRREPSDHPLTVSDVQQ